MDKIYRKISLEPSKNRTPNMLPYYYVKDGECILNDSDTEHHPWGEYCVDLLIPLVANECDSDTPCVQGLTWAMELWRNFNLERVEIENKEANCTTVAYWGRYKNLMRIYHWLINTYIPSITFYTKCGNRFKETKIANKRSVFEKCADVYASISDVPDDFETGGIVGTSMLYEQFIEQFENKDYALNFLLFMYRIEHEGLFNPLTGTTPYVDVNFSITSEQTDMGIMSPLWRKWEPKRKYYLGEVVEYNNKPYMLKKTDGDYDKYELTGDLLASVLKSEENEDGAVHAIGNIPRYKFIDSVEGYLNKINNISFSSGGNGIKYPIYTQFVLKETDGLIDRYYFIYPYYTGYYDANTMSSSFDDVNQGHWEEMKTKPTSVSANEQAEYTGITESELYTLKRKVTSVDDYGETLPFIYYTDEDNVMQKTTQLFYRGGPVNERSFRNENEVCNADWMYSIRYKENEEDEWIDIDLNNMRKDMPDETEGIIYSDNFECESGICEFTYFIGCNVDVAYDKGDNEKLISVTKTRVENTGVKYVEVWGFEKKNMEGVHINQTEYDFEYIYLYPINQDEYSDGNVDINGKIPIYSIVTYYNGQLCKDYSSVPFYKDEDLNGIQDINTLEYDMQEGTYVSTIDAYIERGISASFERHNILGEIKTFADLENYRNDYFNITNS